MDVLVRWNDGTINVVSSNELKTFGIIEKGSSVKMFYEKKWYSGIVIETEETAGGYSTESSNDDVPLGNLVESWNETKTLPTKYIGK